MADIPRSTTEYIEHLHSTASGLTALAVAMGNAIQWAAKDAEALARAKATEDAAWAAVRALNRLIDELDRADKVEVDEAPKPPKKEHWKSGGVGPVMRYSIGEI